MVFTIIATVVLLYALALLFFLPMREVTQPPGKHHSIWEVLFPGTSPAWHVFGGVVLVAWVYLVIQDLLMIFIGTPYVLAAISMVSAPKGYGVPGPSSSRGLYALINPSWLWVYLAPAVLFAVNLILVLRSRRRA